MRYTLLLLLLLSSHRSELVAANGLLEGDAWTNLKSVSGTLAAISMSLESAVQEQQQQQQRGGEGDVLSDKEAAGNKLVAEAFKVLSQEFSDRFAVFNSNGVVYGAAAVGNRRR
jgi:hypothetical protein